MQACDRFLTVATETANESSDPRPSSSGDIAAIGKRENLIEAFVISFLYRVSSSAISIPVED
jgi:hypothetical protein